VQGEIGRRQASGDGPPPAGMDRVPALGVALTVLSLVGYAAGVIAPYPGREASLIGAMVGLALVGFGN